MSKRLIIFLVLFRSMSLAQFTQVQGQVLDPSGRPYADGTIIPTLIISGSPRFAASGFPYVPPTTPTGLDGQGRFVMSLADVTQLLPTGGLWSFTVCSGAGTIPPAGGAGPVCFTTVGIIISGSVQDISAVLQAAAPPLTGPGGPTGTVTSLTAGAGIILTPNPITSTGTIAATGGGGSVTSVSCTTPIVCAPSPITGTGTVSMSTPLSISNGGTGSANTTSGLGSIAGFNSGPTTLTGFSTLSYSDATGVLTGGPIPSTVTFPSVAGTPFIFSSGLRQ